MTIPTRVTPAQMAYARARVRKARRAQRVMDNAALTPSKSPQDAQGRDRTPVRVSGRRVPAKTLRKRLVAQLDQVYSLAVRARDSRETGGACVLGCGPIQCVSHLITRAKYSVRWDMRNGTGQCHGANFRHEFDPHPYTSWYIRKHGLEAYETLVRDSNRIAKFSNDELAQILNDLKSKLENPSCPK